MYKTRKALAQLVLNTLTSSPLSIPTTSVISENMENPDTSDPWCQMWFKPNIPIMFTLGENGLDEMTGIFLANIHIPLDVGNSLGVLAADTFRDVFVGGKHVIFDDREVSILRCGANLGRIVDTWYRADITIYWRVYLSRGNVA